MWAEAHKLDVPARQALNGGHRIEFLSDLTDAERRTCLQRVHVHLQQNRSLQRQHGGFVERGNGPALDTPIGDPSFDYNGVAPMHGRNFRWYRKAVFQDQLRRFGWTAVKRTTGRQVYETISERQCMLALQATNDALALCSQATGHLEPYLGPQCYPQVRDEARYRANEPKASGSADEPATLPAAREQLGCWLQCDDCRRWRLVERKSFPAVNPAAAASRARTTTVVTTPPQ